MSNGPTAETLMHEVTASGAHVTDADVAERHGVEVGHLRRALRILEYFHLVRRMDSSQAKGSFWEARQPNNASPRVQRLQAAMTETLDGFLAMHSVLELESEMKSAERTTTTIPAGGPITIEGPGEFTTQEAELPDGTRSTAYNWKDDLFLVVMVPPGKGPAHVESNGHIVFESSSRTLRVSAHDPMN